MASMSTTSGCFQGYAGTLVVDARAVRPVVAVPVVDGPTSRLPGR